MKPILTKALLASAGIALFAHGAMAATLPNEDVLLSFREAGDSDLILDLGNVSQFLNTTSDINLNTIVASYDNATYTTVSSLIDAVFGSASGVTWSVTAYNKPGASATDVYATAPSGGAGSALTQGTLTTASTDISTVGGTLKNAIGANILISAGSPSTIEAAKATASGSASYTTTAPKIRSALGNTAFESTIGSSGSSSAAFYDYEPSGTGFQAPLDGTFVLGADGSAFYDVTSAAAPEPAMYGAIAGFGLLALALRGQLTRRQA
jgi:hypothetical protein